MTRSGSAIHPTWSSLRRAERFGCRPLSLATLSVARAIALLGQPLPDLAEGLDDFVRDHA